MLGTAVPLPSSRPSPVAQSPASEAGDGCHDVKGLLHFFAELNRNNTTSKAVGGPGLHKQELKLLADDLRWECFYIGGVK